MTISTGELLTMAFNVTQSIVGFSVLDFFEPGNGTGGSPDTGDSAAEQVNVQMFNVGNASIFSDTFTSTTKTTTLGYQAFAFAAVSGVARIVFTAVGPSTSDFALASVVTPIPGAALLFGSALAGLGWMRRRRGNGGSVALAA